MKKETRKEEAHHISKVLRQSLKRVAGRQDLELLSLWGCWKEAVGEEVAEHTEPKAFRGSLLHVTVDSSVWVHHLSLMKGDILKKINEKLGEETLHEIRFTIGPLKAHG